MPITKSWKTSVAGIAAIVVGLLNLVIDTVQKGAVSTEALGICITAVVAGVGLMNAKDGNVSNSPTPLVTPQLVSLAPVIAVAPPTTPDIAAVVVVRNPAVSPSVDPAPVLTEPKGPHLVE